MRCQTWLGLHHIEGTDCRTDRLQDRQTAETGVHHTQISITNKTRGREVGGGMWLVVSMTEMCGSEPPQSGHSP